MRLNLDEFARLMHTNGHTTQVDMGRALNLDKATICRVLNGKNGPGTKFYAAFRTAFPNEPADQYFTYA